MMTADSFLVSSRYTFEQFHGIMLNIEVARTFTTGYNQAQAYMRDFDAKLDTTTANSIKAYFGIGSATSIGSLTVNSSAGRIDFHVMQTDILFLLYLQDMNRLGIYLNNLKNKIVMKDEFTIPIIRLHEYLFMILGLTSVNYLTDIELRQLHRRFGYSSVNRLVRTLERAEYDDSKHRYMLQRITEFYIFCQKHSRFPGRFRFTLKDENNAYFNHTIVIDVLYIDSNLVLQVVDEGISFQAARWLMNMSASHIWDMLRLC